VNAASASPETTHRSAAPDHWARNAISILWVPYAPPASAPNGLKDFNGKHETSLALSMGRRDKRAGGDAEKIAVAGEVKLAGS
jgi:hypothetical protein